MARLTYRKSIKVAPGIRLNVTDKGVRSVSAGAKGLRLTQDLHGDHRPIRRSITPQAAQLQPTQADRDAAFVAQMSPEGAARHNENKALFGLWAAAVVALLISLALPLAFAVSLPLLVVAIVRSVKLRRARRLV